MVKGALSAGVLTLAAVGYFAFFDDDRPFTTYRYRAMCDEPRSFSQAAPRSDGSPRPVFVTDFWPVADSNPTELNAADLKIWAPTQPATVQLVACVTRTGQGEYVKRCEYVPTDDGFGNGAPTRQSYPFFVDLYKGVYKVTVYEARSGRSLGSAEIQGDSFRPEASKGSASEPCSPRSVVRGLGESSTQEGRPRVSQLRDVLDAYVLK